MTVELDLVPDAVRIFVDDAVAARAFYRDVLGFTLQSGSPEVGYLVFRVEQLNVIVEAAEPEEGERLSAPVLCSRTLSDALYQPFPIATEARGQIWHHVPATRKPRHFHAEPELNLVTRGTASFAMGDKVLQVVAGDLLWWPPGQDHVLVDASADFDLFVIGVTAEFSSRVLSGISELGGGGPIQSRLAPAELAEITAGCVAARSATNDVAVIERQVGDLWRRAHALRRASPSMHSVTRRTMASLYESPECSRSDVARLVRAYPSEVSRTFHDDMGITLSAFRSRLRLLRFIEAVDAGAENLLTAALGAGFGSYSQCHRIFQRTLGCTPRLFFETSLRDEMKDALEPWA